MYKWFITRIPDGNKFSWDAYDIAYKEAFKNSQLQDSKYILVREAKKDITFDLLYICAKWIDPPEGTTFRDRGYEYIFRNGKDVTHQK